MKPSADLEKGAVGASSIQRHFGTLPDPRVQRGQAHLLLDVVTIAILAVIAGAKGWDDMEVYAKAHEPWLRGFLELPGGPPSDDTFRRIFVRLNAKAFRNCFMAWMSALAGSVAGMLIAIDGKTLRRSFDCASGRTALHLVHAWAAENRVLLGQVATAEKSNEITAIPELLDLLELKGAIVTIDAMGCQRKIVEKIVEKGADYAIALKGNQEKLHDEVAGYLDAAIADGGARLFETRDEGHGRVEVRRLYAVSNVAWLSAIDAWPGLRSLVCVERERTANGKTSVERIHYITSIPAHHVRRLARIIRGHWGVENALHWSLDVSFNEDACRIRSGDGPENFALLRRIALILLRRESSMRAGAPTKLFRAAADPRYAMRVLLTGIPAESNEGT